MAVHEGIVELLESDIIRTRKNTGLRQLPPGLISQNLAAISRIVGERTTGRFRAFLHAFRQSFGLAVDRAREIQRGLDNGTLDRAHLDGYLNKLVHGDPAGAEVRTGAPADSGPAPGALPAAGIPVAAPAPPEVPQAALGKMPPIYRHVLEATHSGMTPPQVAEKLGISEKGVGNILREVQAAAARTSEAGNVFKSVEDVTNPGRTGPALTLGHGGATKNTRVDSILSPSDGQSSRVKGLSDADRQMILSEMGDTARLDNDTHTHLSNESTNSNEQRGQTNREVHPQEILRHRARSLFARSEEVLGRLRRDHDGAEEFFGTPVQEKTREAWLAQITAVATGRKQLFHDTFPDKAASALKDMIHEVMHEVRTEFREGHLIAWRPDLLPYTGAELIDLCKELPQARNGLLMGYGQESMSASFEPHALVLIKDESGATLVGFHTPIDAARIYAEARLRDLHDATGKDYKIEIIPRR